MNQTRPFAVTVAPAGLEHIAELAPLFDGYRGFYHQPSDPRGAVAYLTERLSRDECVVFMARVADDKAGEGASAKGGSPSNSSPAAPRAPRPAGFTLLYPLFSSVSMRRIWLLNDLFVAPEARRRGVALALMARATDFARQDGAIRLTLRTDQDNAEARALYHALGFVLDERFLTYNLKLG